MRVLRVVGIGIAGLILGLAVVVLVAGRGAFGRFDSEQLEPRAPARDRALVDAEAAGQSRARAAMSAPADPVSPVDRQILFGDLHVHTTISFDAFMLALPLLGGEGAHPPADACDFARHCSALDFWSINDHAANIHPDDWANSVESVRQCNALAGDSASPDMVTFLGWEWTQVGLTPETHYGHKNVVLRGTDEGEVPSRPVAASAGGLASGGPPVWARGALALQGARYRDLARRWTALGEVDVCAEGPVRELPNDCREIAATPAALFAKLDDWGHDAIVIPHGTTWGVYTPPGSTWDKQLGPGMHDPAWQTLIEVYSGHGGSEVYRDWRSVWRDADGDAICPEERPDYRPMCRRAGELVEQRCLAEGVAVAECAERAEQARANAVAAGVSPHVTVPGTRGDDWLDSGQCRDCGQPAFKYRPGSSSQYIAALGGFDAAAGEPRRFRMGFVASSDIHNARAGTGYKELPWLTDSGGKTLPDEESIVRSFLQGPEDPPEARSRTYEVAAAKLSGLQLYENERTQSYLYTGGLVAVHAEGRDRDAIWDAFQRKETYGTSGPRILLWFDLLRGDQRLPMGSEIGLREAPVFEVRALGSLEQLPGCPEETASALGPERLEALCRGECHRPGEQRRAITRVEIVRIRPQNTPGEDVAPLIDDPWRSFDCPADGAGCSVRFDDPDFMGARRDHLYYVRVFEAPVPTLNGANLDCRLDPAGRCTQPNGCDRGGDCLQPYAARAWSSPIYVDWLR